MNPLVFGAQPIKLLTIKTEPASNVNLNILKLFQNSSHKGWVNATWRKVWSQLVRRFF